MLSFSIADTASSYAIQQDLTHAANLVLFAHIVRAGGITRCAERLGMERTTVSRRLKSLETTLGTQLVVRSAREFATTASGQHCFEQCAALVKIMHSLRDIPSSGSLQASDASVRVSVAQDIDADSLQNILCDFEDTQTGSVSTVFSDSPATSQAFDNHDLQVRWTTDAVTHGEVRTLASLSQSIYASPAFISDHGCPQIPEDLQNMPCLVIDGSEKSRVWTFHQQRHSYDVNLRHVINTPSLRDALDATLAGEGCCQLPHTVADALVLRGSLAKIVSRHRTTERRLVTVIPAPETCGAIVRELRDFLHSHAAQLRLDVGHRLRSF